MPLIETLIATVAPAIAKTVVKLWAAEDKVASEGGAAAIEALTKLVPDIRARKEAERQLQTIGEKAAESLLFIFNTEGKHLLTDDQEAVANLVAQTLDHTRITAQLLLQKDLDPVRLAQHFIAEATEQLVLFPEHRAKLFTRVIEEASQSIVDIARVLPNFSERTFAELLRRDRVLIDAAERTLANLERIRSEATDEVQAEGTRFETEYRRAVVRNLNKVELFGVDLSRASRSHPLSVAYVSLEVGSAAKRPPGTPGAFEEDGQEGEEDESAVHDVETVLAGEKRLLVKGPAGAGKTTLVHWVAVRAASRSFEYPLQEWNGAIPFVIRLRQFSDSPLPRPEEFPSLVAPTIADTMPRGWVHGRMNSGNALIMVDGVDEVAEARRSEVRKWIKELVETFPGCRFIVTSRPHAVEQHWMDSEGFGEADLQPMDTAGIETFVDHWHMAVAEEVQREEEIALLERLAQNLKRTLRSNRAIRRLATNPLLCSVICALHRDTKEQLPEDRLELYERCCSMLLERRDPESGLTISGYPRLSYRQKRALLDDLAYWMLKNDWSEVPIASARDRFDRKIETFRSDGKDGFALTGDSAVRFFVERSAILRHPIPGKIDFAHRTFQEFMAANCAMAEGDMGVLIGNATNPQWREVIVLGAGLARPGERTTLIQSLLTKGDSDRAALPQLHLMAAACLDAAVDVETSLRKEVERRLKHLFPPKSVSEGMQIADAAGEMAVPFLRRGNRYTNATQSAACVRALAMIGSLEAVQAIAEYGEDEYGTVSKEVMRASDRIEPGLFLDVIAPHLNPRHLHGDAVAHALRKFGIERMSLLQEAEELALSGVRAGDLSILQRLPNLQRLTLRGPSVADLNPLSCLRKLTYLSLSRVAVEDLSPLRELPNLASLSVSYGDLDATQLVGVVGLTSLWLWSVKLGNAIALRDLHGLRSLSLLDVQEGNLSFLKNMSRLTTLRLSRPQGTDLTPLQGLRDIEELDLSFTTITDAQWMADLTNLETLRLYSVEISDPSSLPPLPKLQKLSIKASKTSSELLAKLRRTYPGARVST